MDSDSWPRSLTPMNTASTTAVLTIAAMLDRTRRWRCILVGRTVCLTSNAGEPTM